MKFLHLSDLHIGKNVNGFSMHDEQRHAFKQINRYIESERPDAVVIAGDIYDRAVPSVESVCMFDDFLTELAGADTAVLIVPGNHDSPERLNYAGRLLAEKRIFLGGAFAGKMSRVTLPDDYGDVNFWLLPFIRPSSVRGMFGERVVETYSEAVAAAIEASDVDFQCRNVLVAHQFFTGEGIFPVRSDSEMNLVGGLDAAEYSPLKKFDYAALGHLHGSQTVGEAHLLYSGSPVKYSFSERLHKKSVPLVEIREKGSLSIANLPIEPLHEMREVKGRLCEILERESANENRRLDYLRVILTDNEEIIDPMGKIRSVCPNVMALEFENLRTGVDISAIVPADEAAESIRTSAYELFSEFFLDINGAVMGGEQANIVRELLEAGEDE